MSKKIIPTYWQIIFDSDGYYGSVEWTDSRGKHSLMSQDYETFKSALDWIRRYIEVDI